MSFARFLVIATTCATIMPLAAVAATSSSDSTPVTRAELPALVKQAIMDNPDIIMQAAEKLREKQAADSAKQAKEAMEKDKTKIFKDDKSPVVGSKDADVTVVEFFDYHCGYCKHMLPAITQLLKEDKKVRIIFKEFPILSEDSVSASRAALAAYRIEPDKYFDYYTALMNSNGKFDDKSLLDAAGKVGIDKDKLKAEMAKTDITAELDKNRALAQDIGIHGTLALIIGSNLSPGAMSYEDLKKAVDEARSGKKSASTDATPKS